MEIAVIGNDEFITGFQLAGIKNSIKTKEENLNSQLNKIIEEKKIGILIMDENDYDKLNRQLKIKLEKSMTPVIITLTKEAKESNLRELVKKSVGIDLWK